MKKTILILAAIFIANNIFSQYTISNLDDTLKASINQFNEYLIKNGENPLNIDNGIFKRIATDEMKRFTDSSFQKLKCVALSKKWGVTIPLTHYGYARNENHPHFKKHKSRLEKSDNFPGLDILLNSRRLCRVLPNVAYLFCVFAHHLQSPFG